MIGYLTGKPLFENEEGVIIDVNGIGYSVACTPQTKTLIMKSARVSLYIHTVVRETILDLYGFETENELLFFKRLLNVSGIGPRSALALLSIASPETLYRAIVNEQVDFLTSLPGIGKKTAERICVELKDKLSFPEWERDENERKEDRDVYDALIALGYTSSEVHRAMAEIPEDLHDTQERIKYALKQLS